MSNIKSMNHQAGLNVDPTKNITLSNDAGGDLVIQRGTVETNLVEIGRFKNAGGLEYLPSDTGAVATTVQEKLRESVSVKDFGADRTGATIEVNGVQYSTRSEWSGILNPGDTLKVTTAISCNRRKARLP